MAGLLRTKPRWVALLEVNSLVVKVIEISLLYRIGICQLSTQAHCCVRESVVDNSLPR